MPSLGFGPMRTVRGVGIVDGHARIMHFRSATVGGFQQHGLGFRSHASHDERRAVLDDARLFPSDGANVRTQELLMIQSDVRNGSNQGLWKTLVLSKRPPIPVSKTTASTSSSANQVKAMPKVHSKTKAEAEQTPTPVGNVVNCTTHSLGGISPLTRIRSLKSVKCGDVNRPPSSLCLQCIGKSGTNGTFAIGPCHVDDMI